MRYLIWLHYRGRKYGFALRPVKIGDKRRGVVKMIPLIFKRLDDAKATCDLMVTRPRIKRANVVRMT